MNSNEIKAAQACAICTKSPLKRRPIDSNVWENIKYVQRSPILVID